MRLSIVVVAALAAVLSVPAPVRAEDACDSWIFPCLGSILGIDKYNEEQTEQARIGADARVQIQTLQAFADANRANQATQQVLIEQTQATVRRALELPYELEKAQIENQADVAIQGITELGLSKRTEIIQEGRLAVIRTVIWGAGSIVALVLVAALIARRRQTPSQAPVYFLEEPSCNNTALRIRSTTSRF